MLDAAPALAQQAPPLLRLPPELHLLIAEHLSLAGRLIFQRSVCTQLRPNSQTPARSADVTSALKKVEALDQVNCQLRTSVLIPRHRFSLAQARQAADEIVALRHKESSDPQQDASLGLDPIVAPQDQKTQALASANSVFWDAARPPEPPPAARYKRVRQPRWRQSVNGLDSDIPSNCILHEGPVTEARFAIMALEVLTGICGSPNEVGTGARVADATQSQPLRTLSLIGLFGLPGALVLHLLRNHPALRSVQTVVKTERFDVGAWRPSSWQTLSPMSAQIDGVEVYVPAGDWSGGHRMRAPSGSSADIAMMKLLFAVEGGRHEPDGPIDPAAEPYICTQALVRVGSRLGRSSAGQQVPISIKGMGIQVGFECWCYVHTRSATVLHEADKDSAHANVDDGEGPNVPSIPPSTILQPLGIPLRHVILQGRYTLQEALEAETMLEYSDVTCNACKETIEF